MVRAYEFRIYPNKTQRDLIERTFGCSRWVYNRCLEERKTAYEQTKKSLSRWQLTKMLPVWKNQHPWLREVDSHALQYAVAYLCRAYDNFFRRCKQGGKPGYPRFKSKSNERQSYTTAYRVSVVDNCHIKLPKLGLVKAKISRPVEGRIVSATVKRVPSGKYFCVLTCTDCPEPDIPLGPVDVMGIDAGVKDLMTRSDGKKVPNPKALSKSQKKLAREQRRLSRKKDGSKNRAKQKRKVARVYEKITNQRKDAIHKATTDAVRESQAIAVEDLNIRGMVKNHHLAKAISDASMGEMIRQLEYKCEWYGRRFVKVGRFYPSSKTCSACGCVLDKLPLSVREWDCPECGVHHDRDINAAMNIATEGIMILNGTVGSTGTSEVDTSETLLEQI